MQEFLEFVLGAAIFGGFVYALYKYKYLPSKARREARKGATGVGGNNTRRGGEAK